MSEYYKENQAFNDEEQHIYRIDLRQAKWSMGDHKRLSDLGGSLLLTVDFVAETENDVLFIEYKNSNISGAENPEQFNEELKSDTHFKKIARKFYGSFLCCHILNKLNDTKPFKYYYICESTKADTTTRKLLRDKIMRQLPFRIQKTKDQNRKIIHHFDVMSIMEWNLSFPKFPFKEIK